MQRQVARATYRAFLREARRLERAHETVTLCAPVDLTKWGSGGYTSAAPDAAALQATLFPGVDFDAAGQGGVVNFDGAAIARVARAEFRRPPPPAATGQQQVVAGTAGGAFTHLATLNRLRASDACRTVTRTKYGPAVVVDVELLTEFVAVLDPAAMAQMGQFPFSYRVRLTNRGTATVQLLGRHWIFTDDKGGVTEVPRNSPGVVGHAPVLEPGQAFEYTSGTQLGTPRGSMQGSFQMAANLQHHPQHQSGGGAPAGSGGAGGSPDMFDAVVCKTSLVGPPGLDEVLRQAAGDHRRDTEQG